MAEKIMEGYISSSKGITVKACSGFDENFVLASVEVIYQCTQQCMK